MPRLNPIMVVMAAAFVCAAPAQASLRGLLATKYDADKPGRRFGITVEKRSANFYRIWAKGNKYSNDAEISNMALLRAAHLAIDEERDYFQIVRSSDISTQQVIRHAGVPDRQDVFMRLNQDGSTSLGGIVNVEGTPASTSLGAKLPGRGMLIQLWTGQELETIVKNEGRSARALQMYPAAAVYAELAPQVRGDVPTLIDLYRDRAQRLEARYAQVRGSRTEEEEDLRRAIMRSHLAAGFAARDAGDRDIAGQAFRAALALDNGMLAARLKEMK